MADNKPIITRYRPEEFDEVLGHTAQIAALQRVINSTSTPHSFLFTGPSGTGKTTLARIVGSALKADVHEIDAASNNGVDAMRDLVEFSQHQAFTETGIRLIIIDECHTLSKPAWQAILKLLEDPPDHLYLALCTTEDDKIPDTIRTRCFSTRLTPIAQQTIAEFLETIAEVEEWHPSQEILDYSAEASNGSPRFALTILQSIHDAPSREEAARIVRLLEPTSDLIDILRHLLDGKRSWVVISKHLKALDGLNFDEVSIQAGRYLSAAMLRSETEEKAKPIWAMLEALVFPAETFDRKVAFITAIGRILWGN